MEESATELIRRILSENPKKAVFDSSLTPAGVTLLLYPKDGEYCILLNKRSDTVDDHKGEISFPGGRKDPEDKTLLDTALRETHEEMGISPNDIDVLGESCLQGLADRQGIKPRRACQVAVNWAVTDDATVHRSIEELISSIFEE